MEETPLKTMLNIQDVEPDPVPRLKEVGIVRKVSVSEPNDKGNQRIFVQIEYPVGSPNKEVIGASLMYNEVLFADTRGLTDGQIKYYNKNKSRIKQLREAGKVQDVGELVGKQIGFLAGPGWPDVTNYEYTGFFGVDQD